MNAAPTPPPKTGSDRSFGLVFAGVFALIGLWPLLDAATPHSLPLTVAVGFAAVALARPVLLAPLNGLWTRFGALLHRIMSPVLMALVFFAVFTPFGAIMRLVGHDPLRRRLARDTESYWIHRKPPGPSADSIRNQY